MRVESRALCAQSLTLGLEADSCAIFMSRGCEVLLIGRPRRSCFLHSDLYCITIPQFGTSALFFKAIVPFATLIFLQPCLRVCAFLKSRFEPSVRPLSPVRARGTVFFFSHCAFAT